MTALLLLLKCTILLSRQKSSHYVVYFFFNLHLFPQGKQEPLMVIKEKVGRPPGELGVTTDTCDLLLLFSAPATVTLKAFIHSFKQD